MYTEDDTMTPRDRISDEMLRRMLGGIPAEPERKAPESTAYPAAPHTGRPTWGLEGYPPASVYAPLQEFRSLYDEDTALQKGTMFAELFFPFMGQTVSKQGGCCHDES